MKQKGTITEVMKVTITMKQPIFQLSVCVVNSLKFPLRNFCSILGCLRYAQAEKPRNMATAMPVIALILNAQMPAMVMAMRTAMQIIAVILTALMPATTTVMMTLAMAWH